MIKAILFTLCILAPTASATTFTICQNDLDPVSAKLDTGLLRMIAETNAAGEDLSSTLILGILKTAGPITTEELYDLFQDNNTQIRAVIHDNDSAIITFTSSLMGVLNAVRSEKIISIQKSQKLRKLADLIKSKSTTLLP